MTNVPSFLKDRITDKDRAYYNKVFNSCTNYECRRKLYLVHYATIFDMVTNKKAKYRKLFRDKLSDIDPLWRSD